MAAGSSSLDRYDTIGVGYGTNRRADPRWAAQIDAAIGDAPRIVNVGAGTGSYEPEDRFLVSVDPSAVMLAEHPGPRRVRGSAERLPFRDDEFDVAMAVLTVHHWRSAAGGLAELRRVSQRQVMVSFDHRLESRFWLSEYVPALLQYQPAPDATIDGLISHLESPRIEVLPVPHDCVDGVMAAYWRRPERYLDPAVRANISGLALLADDDLEPGLHQLAADLKSGAWRDRYRHLLDLDELDAGYRIVIAGRE
jgi:SAM-dependent methyltransferase